MKISFLGDALDHWKGSLFERLLESCVLRDFAVDPMFSDKPWTQHDYEIFARLLRIPPRQVIHHDATLRDRDAYFSEISNEGDLFLDPDTGIATGKVKVPAQYVYPLEVGDLLDRVHYRVLIIYQHVRGQKVAERIDTVVSKLRFKIGDFAWCSYESSTVAMLFLSRNDERIAGVRDLFHSFLGKHATRRIRGSKRQTFPSTEEMIREDRAR